MDEVIKPPKIQRRARIDIVVKILGHIKMVPSRKTQILNECNLNYSMMMRYLDGLIKNEYIIEHSLAPKRGSFYTTSEKGNKVLMELKKSLALVEGVLDE